MGLSGLAGIIGGIGGAANLIGGLGSVFGLLGAKQAAAAAQERMRQQLAQMGSQAQQDYQRQYDFNNRSLMGMAGQGGDAIAALGRRLGDSLAGAGVYNSSATAGALTAAQNNEDAQLAALGQNLQNSAAQRLQDEMQHIGGMQYGMNDQLYNNALNQYGQAAGGLSSFLGNLAQNNLARAGANANRTSIPQVNGTTNQGANLPGNAGYSSPGVGAGYSPYGGGSALGGFLGGNPGLRGSVLNTLRISLDPALSGQQNFYTPMAGGY
jgi:hypothetical protein